MQGLYCALETRFSVAKKSKTVHTVSSWWPESWSTGWDTHGHHMEWVERGEWGSLLTWHCPPPTWSSPEDLLHHTPGPVSPEPGTPDPDTSTLSGQGTVISSAGKCSSNHRTACTCLYIMKINDILLDFTRFLKPWWTVRSSFCKFRARFFWQELRRRLLLFIKYPPLCSILKFCKNTTWVIVLFPV